MRVCLGGTFEVIHRGHRALLDRAFDLGDEVLIGVADDEMAGRKGHRRPVDERIATLEEHLRREGREDFTIVAIRDPFGPAVERGDLDAIVVSRATAATALRLNEARTARGLRPLQIHTVPLALAEDSLPLSTSRILAGEVDEEGRMRRPLRISVGSGNRVKVEATRAVARRIFSAVEVSAKEVSSGVLAQPQGNETIVGSMNRARQALEDGEGDYGVGIEAGLFWNEVAGHHFDVQVCVVVDRRGEATLGFGPGFYYPQAVMGLVQQGKTVSEAIEGLYGIKDVGRGAGAVGFFSEGRSNRRRITEMAVLMAFLPRVRRELYLG